MDASKSNPPLQISKEPGVSVCIPSFNKAEYLGETIESILCQTYRNFQILVIDNCSTDHTHEMIQSKYKQKILYYRNHRNIGATANFNRCISLAQNDLLMILPADDTLLPRFLERTVEWMLKHPAAGLVATNRYYMDKHSAIRKIDEAFFPGTSVLSREYTIKRILERDGKGVTMPLFRKSCLQAISGFRPDIFFGDVFAWFQIGALFDIVYINEPLLTWRMGDSGSMVTKAQRDHIYFDHKIYTYTEMFRFLRKHQITFVDEKSCFKNLLKHNTAKICSIQYPPSRKKLLSYLKTYFRKRCLHLFSFIQLVQISMILMFPKEIVKKIYSAAYRLTRT
jgi:glycosyltransferase involved in cell wall biosynthesis